MKKQFVVIGLGRFESSICKKLYKLGHEVLAIDSVPERADLIQSFTSHTSITKAAGEVNLKALGVHNFEHAIMAVDDDMQTNVL